MPGLVGVGTGEEIVEVIIRYDAVNEEVLTISKDRLEAVKAAADGTATSTENLTRASDRHRTSLQGALGFLTLTNAGLNRMGLLNDDAAKSLGVLIGAVQSFVAVQRLLKSSTDAETGSWWANAAGRAAAWVAANPLALPIIIGAIGATVAAVAAAKATGALAQGGIVMPPGGVFQLAEAGTPEAVIPLGRPEAKRMLGGGGGTVNNIQLVGDARMWDSELRSLMET